jgi:putative ABC transport system substrate-binding protein
VKSRTVVLIVLCALGLLTVALAAVAQPPAKIPQVGILHNGRQADEPRLRVLEEFRQGLHDLGYVEGQNIALEIRWAEGSVERLPALASELVRLKVDVLVVFGPPGVRAARAATNTIPIVMARMDDAEEHGFVASLARPGGNITGLSFQTGELSGKWLEVLKDAVPSVSRVAVLWDATGTVNQRRALEHAAQALGIPLHVVEIQSLSALDGAFEAAKTAQAEGLVILASPVFTQHVLRLAELVVQHRLPAIYYHRLFTEAGGLLAYGPHGADPSWGWRRAAVYVDKILKGAKPGDLPVEQPLKFELVINLKTAKALGITLSPTLLFQADEVIQ